MYQSFDYSIFFVNQCLAYIIFDFKYLHTLKNQEKIYKIKYDIF